MVTLLAHPVTFAVDGLVDYTQWPGSHATRARDPGDKRLRTNTLTNSLTVLSLVFCIATTPMAAARTRWRTATEPELRKLIPARAPVIKENIETEFRTASGVTDGRGRFIAGVVMITAGYSAEGKYSHFFITQTALKVGSIDLTPGEYVFGYQRTNNDTIRVSFYRASSGANVGDVDAHVNRRSTMVRSLLISPPVGDKGTVQVGRFIFDYRVGS